MQTVGASMPQPLVRHHGMMAAAKGLPVQGRLVAVYCAAWAAAAAAAAGDLAAPTRMVTRAAGARRGRLVILRRMVLILLRLQLLPLPRLRKEKNRYVFRVRARGCYLGVHGGLPL